MQQSQTSFQIYAHSALYWLLFVIATWSAGTRLPPLRILFPTVQDRIQTLNLSLKQKQIGPCQSDTPSQTTIWKSEQYKETGISSKNKSKVKINKKNLDWVQKVDQ